MRRWNSCLVFCVDVNYQLSIAFVFVTIIFCLTPQQIWKICHSLGTPPFMQKGTLSQMLASHASCCWLSALGAGLLYNREKKRRSIFRIPYWFWQFEFDGWFGRFLVNFCTSFGIKGFYIDIIVWRCFFLLQ